MPGLLVHSDHGGQYCGKDYRKLLYDHEAIRSQSRRGDCYDNAHAKSFWSRFKAELIDGSRFPGLAEAKFKIGYHVAYYNAEQRYSALGYQSPNHFETHLQTTSQLCSA